MINVWISGENQLTTTKSANAKIPKDDLIGMSKKLNPTIGFWDPLGLADSAFLGNDESTIGWLRHSEIKHGRIAMFAFIGYLAQYEIRFPWAMALDGTPFPILELTPPEVIILRS
jgi:hypothetical protein